VPVIPGYEWGKEEEGGSRSRDKGKPLLEKFLKQDGLEEWFK
jgi:hypothetical protein